MVLRGVAFAIEGAVGPGGEAVRDAAKFRMRPPELAVEPILKLGQGNMGHVPVIKTCERKTKLGAKLFQSHLGALSLRQREIVIGLGDPVLQDASNAGLRDRKPRGIM